MDGAKRRVEVIFVSADSDEAATREWMSAVEMPFPMLEFDGGAPESPSQLIGTYCRVASIPHVAVLHAESGTLLHENAASLLMDKDLGAFPWVHPVERLADAMTLLNETRVALFLPPTDADATKALGAVRTAFAATATARFRPELGNLDQIRFIIAEPADRDQLELVRPVIDPDTRIPPTLPTIAVVDIAKQVKWVWSVEDSVPTQDDLAAWIIAVDTGALPSTPLA
jgi:hypothetical protein